MATSDLARRPGAASRCSASTTTNGGRVVIFAGGIRSPENGEIAGAVESQPPRQRHEEAHLDVSKLWNGGTADAHHSLKEG